MVRAGLAFWKRLASGHVSSVADSFGEGELDAWWRDLAEADAAGRWVWGIGIFTAVRRKP